MQSRTGCSQPGNWHSKRRTTHIILLDAVTELNTGWFSAMLAANANLEFRPRRATFTDSDLHQLAYAITIQSFEWIFSIYFLLNVRNQKASRVIATYTQRCLSEIICPKAEEFRHTR